MRPQTVGMVMRYLGSYHPEPKVNSMGTWGSCSCPLAPWTHGSSGRDRNPSMMVSVEPGVSGVKCLSCGFSGGMLSLVNEVHKYGGITVDTLEELRYLILLEETRHYKMLEKEGARPEIPEAFLDMLDQWHPYLEERGISKQTARAYRLGFDADDSRVLIPIFDWEGNLVGVVGRATNNLTFPKYLVRPTGFDRAKVLFGEHRITGNEPAVLLVEGYFDAVVASQYLPEGVGVLALGSAIPTDEQLRRLSLLVGTELIVGLDMDDAGMVGVAKLRRQLAGSVKLSSISYGEAKDAAELGPGTAEAIAARTDLTFGSLMEGLAQIAS